MPDDLQGSPEDSVHLISDGTSKNGKEQQNNQVSDHVNQGDSVKESHDDYLNDAGFSTLQSNDESMIMQSTEKDVEYASEELEMSILTSADGGRRDPKISRQYASQLSSILTVIDLKKQLASLLTTL